MQRPAILLGLMIAMLSGTASAQAFRERPSRIPRGDTRMIAPPEPRRPARCRDSGIGSLIGAIAGGLLGRAGPRRDDRATGDRDGRDHDRDC